MIYFIYALINLLFILLYDNKRQTKRSNRAYGFLVLFLVLMTGLSYEMGADACTFRSDFEYLPDRIKDIDDIVDNIGIFLIKGYMPLWTILNIVLKSIFDSFIAVQMVLSLCINIAISHFFKKYSVRPFTCLLLFFYFYYLYFNLEVMRESFAIFFGIFAIENCFSKKWVRFSLFTIVAILFHISAVALLLLPLARFKVSFKTLIISGVLSLVLFFSAGIIVSRVPALFMDSALEHKMEVYSNLAASIFGYVLAYIKYLLVPVLAYLLVVNHTSSKDKYILEKMIPFVVLIGIFASAITSLNRWNNYYAVFYIVLVTNLIWECLKKKQNALVPILSVLLLFYIFANEGNRYLKRYKAGFYKYEFYIPYSSVFDMDEDYSYREDYHDTALDEASDVISSSSNKK